MEAWNYLALAATSFIGVLLLAASMLTLQYLYNPYNLLSIPLALASAATLLATTQICAWSRLLAERGLYADIGGVGGAEAWRYVAVAGLSTAGIAMLTSAILVLVYIPDPYSALWIPLMVASAVTLLLTIPSCARPHPDDDSRFQCAF
jgi:hypothetical protein